MAEASGSTAPQASSSSGPALRTHYRKQRSFAPLYTGGAATAVSSDGNYLFAPVNESIHVTHIPSGQTAAQIPSDLEEISCLALSPDQGTLIVASRSLAVRIVTLDYRDDARRNNGEAALKDEASRQKAETSVRVSWSLARSIPKSHDAPVVVMQIDPTGTLLATGAADGCAKVWDIQGGFCTHVFRGHGGVVSSLKWNMPAAAVALETNGSARSRGHQPQTTASRVVQLLSGSIDGRIRFWDLRSSTSEQRAAKPIAVLESHFSVVRGLALSTDGQRLVSVGRDRMLAFWERQQANVNKSTKRQAANDGWTLLETVAAGESLECAGFVDADDTFFTGGAEGELRLWSFSRQAVAKLQPAGRFARGLVGKGRQIKQNEESDDEETEEDETRAITEVHWLPHLRTLASIHADQNIVLRDVASLKSTRQLAGFNDQIIDAAILSPLSEKQADTHLAVATNSTFVRIYTLGAEQHNVESLPSDEFPDDGHKGLILCLDKSPDGRWLASGGKDRTIRIWAMVPRGEAPVAQNAADDEIGEVVGDGNHTKPAAESPELVWRCVAIAEGHTESVGAIAFARRSAAPGAIGAPFMVSGSQDRTAKVWDLAPLAKHFSNLLDGTARTSTIKLASLATQKIHDKDINALDVSPNNALLLTGSQDKTAKVFGIQYTAPSKANSQQASAALKLITTCRGHKRGVWSVAFSPADAVFLTGSSDRTLKLWSINDGFTCVKNYVGHTNSVLKVRFLKGSKGLQCLSGASDGLVKVWNVRTEECLDTLDGHEERVWGLDCTRDGDMLVSGGADGMVRFWKDYTQRADEATTKRKQRDVEQEQRFSNLLATRDYRNAISLALAMRQPRRLLNLFTTVGSQRQQNDASKATGTLLDSALQRSGGRSGQASSVMRDPELTKILAHAGVLTRSDVRQTSALANGDNAQSADAASITGSSAVDRVIETLRPQELATLLTFVRDWNTSVRTSGVAQTTLHAILRFHSADAIVAAFDTAAGKRPKQDEMAMNGGEDADAQGKLSEDEDDDAAMNNGKGRRYGTVPSRPVADLGNVLDALVPYTQRHYDRAQRILTESAMLEYTLSCMDTVLGVDEDDETAGARADDARIRKVNGTALQHDLSISDDASDEDQDYQSDEDEDDEMDLE